MIIRKIKIVIIYDANEEDKNAYNIIYNYEIGKFKDVSFIFN